MKTKWSEIFHEIVKSNGLDYMIKNRVHGWIETSIIENHICYVKSATYDYIKRQYFLGVDPKKLHESGNLVIFCGGADIEIRDIFLIPWNIFFETLEAGEPVNTYNPPREYWQYKFYLRDRYGKWLMLVQPTSHTSSLDVSKWHFNIQEAILNLKTKDK